MRRNILTVASLATLFGFIVPATAAAQTDYYNTDLGRPVVIEDAYPTERYAFELQLAPVRLERSGGGVYTWGIEPEIAYGILPRTHVEVGAPLAFIDAGGDAQEFGLAGIDLSVLHNLNTETAGLPAFGIAAGVLLPVGEFAPDRAYPSAKAIATRTFGFARFHVNGLYTFGSEPDRELDPGEEAVETSRWLAGVAVDKTFPLRAMLLIGNVYARQPILEDEDLEWNAGAGLRYQLSPRLAIDGGAGRRLTGEDQAWFLTFGAAYAFAIRSLIPAPLR
ncbi:MAG: transporter [Chloroflexi bacterium]|nr:transporter [Chloroflexota bacterium]